MIVFIPFSANGCKPGDYDGEWLPRQCPGCGEVAVIGHGRRWRQAHDEWHDSIRVRRGLCRHCDGTLTVLPHWCVPGAHYTLTTRQRAMERLGQGLPADQAAPDCLDPDRLADPSTIRRWFWRRIPSLRFIPSPTLLAWDFRAAARMLIGERVPP